MDINRLVGLCYDALPPGWRLRPWEKLNHGRAVLETEDHLNAYISAYGEMHMVKCRMALRNFPFESLVSARSKKTGDITLFKPFDVYDWGCGQGIATMVFLQMLHERDMLHGLRSITLIEPSGPALDRATYWIRQCAHRSTEIKSINRYIPDNDRSLWDDLGPSAGMSIHLCSNILDIRTVGLKWLAEMTTHLGSAQIYVCVGPPFGRGISRIVDFYNYLGSPDCFTDICSYPCGYTSRTNHPFGIEAKCFTHESGEVEEYEEQSDQYHVDEYHVGEECLTGALDDNVLKAYYALREVTEQSSFELYLKPSIGVERPDFVIMSISQGVVLVNVCSDGSSLELKISGVEAMKQALIDTYIKSLKIDMITHSSVFNAIKIGLYFPETSRDDVMAQLHGCSTTVGTKDHVVLLFPDDCVDTLRRLSTNGFRSDFYEEIKRLMVGNWHSYSQGDLTLRLTRQQKNLIDSQEPRLRIRGVAGSGKTHILAYKAVNEHLRTGTKVLIITYNISLIQYIRMRIHQVPADFCTDAFEIVNYHRFFTSMARRYGREIQLSSYNDGNFFKINSNEIMRNGDMYDTILVDEAQDFMTAWFDNLSCFLSANGRFIIFGDSAQNLYGRQMDTTTRLPVIHTFGSPWRKISDNKSFRLLNPGIGNLASAFADKFGISDTQLVTDGVLKLYDYKVRYWMRPADLTCENIAENIRWIICKYNLDLMDVAVLGQSINLLRDIDDVLRSRFEICTMTTFESKQTYEEIIKAAKSRARSTLDLRAVRRVAKTHFTTAVRAVKLATVHSFKGWESKSVILLIQDEKECFRDEDDGYSVTAGGSIPGFIYVGITRARHNLFIINLGNGKFDEFFKNNISND